MLTTFINDAGLQGNGSNLFVATPASGNPQNGTPGLNDAPSFRTSSTSTWQRIGAQASDNGNILPVGIEIGSGVKPSARRG